MHDVRTSALANISCRRVEARPASFPFLQLPPEIRNRVYSLFFDLGGTTTPSTEPPISVEGLYQYEKKEKRKEKPQVHSVLSLLATCHSIHDEAVGIFYHINPLFFYWPAQMQAFLTTISSIRQNSIRSLSLYYHNQKQGNINTIDLTLQHLRALKGLQSFELIMNGESVDTRTLRFLYGQLYYSRNPATMPGIKILSTLRGINRIVVRDLMLEQQVEMADDDTQDHATLLQARAFKHLNAALRVAQKGYINSEIMEKEDWHREEPFPRICECTEKGQVCTTDGGTCLMLS